MLTLVLTTMTKTRRTNTTRHSYHPFCVLRRATSADVRQPVRSGHCCRQHPTQRTRWSVPQQPRHAAGGAYVRTGGHLTRRENVKSPSTSSCGHVPPLLRSMSSAAARLGAAPAPGASASYSLHAAPLDSPGLFRGVSTQLGSPAPPSSFKPSSQRCGQAPPMGMEGRETFSVFPPSPSAVLARSCARWSVFSAVYRGW